jgi:hypothetical protein
VVNARLRHSLSLSSGCSSPSISSSLKTLDAQLHEAKIAIGQIRSLKELAETDWAKQWGAVREVPDRRGGSYLIHGYPWRFSDDELGPRRAPAFRGEHNEQVFRGLGLSESEVRAAVEAGILVGGVPDSMKNAPSAALTAPADVQDVAELSQG